jgi:hypothetical protein
VLVWQAIAICATLAAVTCFIAMLYVARLYDGLRARAARVLPWREDVG